MIIKEPTEEMIAKGAHVLSEWLDDNAPLHERRYRDPAAAAYKLMKAIEVNGPQSPEATEVGLKFCCKKDEDRCTEIAKLRNVIQACCNGEGPNAAYRRIMGGGEPG